MTDNTLVLGRSMPRDNSHRPNVSAFDSGVSTAPTEQTFFELNAVRESIDKARDTIGRRTKKLVAIIIGLLLIVATIVGYAVSVVTRQADSLESVHRELISANEQVFESAVAVDLAIRSFLLSGDSSYIVALESARPKLLESIARLERVAVNVGDQGLLQLVGNSSSIASIWLSTFVDRTTIVGSADTPHVDQLAGAELVNKLRDASLSVSTYINDVNDKAVVVSQRMRRQTIAVAALVLIIALIVIAALLVMSTLDISYPLINLSRVVNRIYSGEGSARADDTVGPAEIRAVARAVNELALQQETAHKWVTQFNLAKTNFLNNVSHELLSPLTLIIGYSEIFKDEDQLTSTERNRVTNLINRNAFRLNDLVDNMLIVLRIDSMQVRFRMRIFDIRDIIEESIESFRTLVNSNELTIVADLGDRTLMVRADANETRRVIDNLISNAVKFSASGGRIDVSAGKNITEEGKHEVVISVKDLGMGILTAELPHIGSRFFRSSNAIAAAIPGMGLGLMIVDFIVQEHGGSWSIASSGAEGTTVEVRLLAQQSTIET